MGLFDKLLNRPEKLQAGISYNQDDLINDETLSNEQKRQILQANLQNENARLDNELNKELAKKYAGAGLEIGSAFIPIGAGARLGAGITKAIAPKIGQKLAQEVGTGLASGALSGAVEGFGRGMVEDDNPLKNASIDSLIGLATGGLGGYGLGKIQQGITRKNLLNNWNDTLGKQYFNDYVSGVQGGNALSDFRGIKNGIDKGNKEIAHLFVGEKGFYSPKGKLMEAKQMKMYGDENKDINSATGWFQGVDGKWRYEIPDGEIIESPILNEEFDDDIGTYFTGKLADIYKNDELYKNYPQLKNRSIMIQNMRDGVNGSSWGNTISLNKDLYKIKKPEYVNKVKEIENSQDYINFKKYEENAFKELDKNKLKTDEDHKLYDAIMQDLEEKTNDFYNNNSIGKAYSDLVWQTPEFEKMTKGLGDNAKSTLLHELQHQIQEIEDFARGGGGLDPDYKNLAGEVEARLVSARRNLTPEQRKIYNPANESSWLGNYGYDVVPDKQIVKMGNGESLYKKISNPRQ